MKLKAAKGCVGGRPRSWSGFALVEMLNSTEKSCTARLAGNWDQYKALSRRTRILLRRDNERYVRSLIEDFEVHLNANDLQPVKP